ncbi:MAG: T9SS type A sorting domain-containing protein [Flavobacteriales bacterium]|nr:T9SS type A sorting domain-containing protein [Flavobacteriales bacterium]
MGRTVYLFTLALLISLNVQAGVILHEGTYQGKNLYVLNPFAGSGVGFCTFEVTVNDEITTDELNSSAFEIDFTALQIELGGKVEVKIKHKDDCTPKVLNPEVLKPKSTYVISSIKVDKGGVLRWTTNGESGELPFTIEQFRWNKWIKLGQVDGKGTTVSHNYSFKVAHHSGENKYRVKQVDFSRKPRYSPNATFNSPTPNISFTPLKVNKEIIFTSSTMYEIFDQYGNLVKKGADTQINVSNLKKGIYYLNFDNQMESFVKK